MKQVKILTILSVVFNALIVIGAGHGIGILFFLEIFGLKILFTAFSSIHLMGTYDEKLVPIALISLVFQIGLIVSLFVKNTLKRKLLINISSFVLLFSLFYLTKDFLDSNVDRLTLLSGIPFVICGISLILKTNRVL